MEATVNYLSYADVTKSFLDTRVRDLPWMRI